MSEDRAPTCLLRSAREEDLEAVLTLVRESGEAPRWTEGAWRAFAAGDSAGEVSRLLLLAESCEGALCGLLAATCLAGETELEFVLVTSSARRTGIGRSLVLSWLTWAEDCGASAAILEVRASNKAAQALYEAVGFVREGTRPRYYQGPVEDSVLMRRLAGRIGQDRPTGTV